MISEKMMQRYESDMFKELQRIQNYPQFQDIDIISITCLMDDKQFEEHVKRYKEYL